MAKITETKMTRLEWFQSKIGHRIYRNAICGCDHCQRVTKDGIVVQDMLHAQYLYEIEDMGLREGSNLRYFETKYQALNYNKEEL
jgi:hypothetical protein